MPIIKELRVSNHGLQRVRERLIDTASRDDIQKWLVGRYIATRCANPSDRNANHGYVLSDAGLVWIFDRDRDRPEGTFVLLTMYIEGSTDEPEDVPTNLD